MDDWVFEIDGADWVVNSSSFISEEAYMILCADYEIVHDKNDGDIQASLMPPTTPIYRACVVRKWAWVDGQNKSVYWACALELKEERDRLQAVQALIARADEITEDNDEQ